MATVKFKKGELANLPVAKEEGVLYITTDERAIYLDVDADTRIRLGDFQIVDSVENLPTGGAAETALFYIKNINVLARYDKEAADGAGKWVQINPDTGMTSVAFDGSGNAITGASYDTASRKLTLTKGETFLTSANVEAQINAKIGDMEQETVVEYIAKQLEAYAKADVVSQLKTDVQGNTTKIQANTKAIETLNGDKETEGSVQKQIETRASAIEEQIETQTTTINQQIQGIKDIVGETPLEEVYAKLKHQHAMTDITGLNDALEAKADATDLESAKSDIDDLKSKIGGVTGAMHFKGTVAEDPTTMEDVHEYSVGDVVVFGEKEYVFAPSGDPPLETAAPGEGKFVELGDTTEVGKRISTLESWKTTAEATYAKSADVTSQIAAAKTALIGEGADIDATTIKGAVTEARTYTDAEIAKLNETYATDAELSTAVGNAKTALVGTDGDTGTSETIKGAKKYAESLVEWGSF